MYISKKQDVINYIKKIENNKFLDCLAELYTDFPYRCNEISNIIFKLLNDNVGIFLSSNVYIYVCQGYYMHKGSPLNHSWIDCGDFIIDPTVIQFTALETEEFNKFNNFGDYFKSNGGPTKTIITNLGGFIIEKKSELYKNYIDHCGGYTNG